MPHASMRPRSRAFTLIELLVVLIIIAIIIAIVLPALRHVRNSARSATTRGMMTQISNAAGAFTNDNRRAPGYFTARDMGGVQNLTQGFSAMQNIMLDLAGGVVADGTAASAPQAGDIKIGPGTTPATTAWVRPDLMGSTGGSNPKVYYTPDAKHWLSQNAGGQQVGIAENLQLRSVVDDFGNPLLAFSQDETAVGQITTVAQFAKVSLSGNNDPSARFYWASNSCFLSATALGARSYNQVRGATLPSDGSIIGSVNASNATAPADADKSLCGILGSPSFPYRAPSASQAPTVPASARSPLTIISAGADGIYFSARDRGAKQFSQPYFDYQMSFVKTSGTAEVAPNLYTDNNGKREVIDLTKQFDDLIATGGN